MKKIFTLGLIFIFLQIQAQQKEIKSFTFDEFQNLVQQKDNKLYVVNFWATWCKPCIEELPGFMEVNKIYADNPNFKMILISLDHPNALNSRVPKFVERNNLDVDVYLLDEKRAPNEWMPLIDSSWMGAIPATVFYKNGQIVKFKQFSITQYELEDLVDELIN